MRFYYRDVRPPQATMLDTLAARSRHATEVQVGKHLARRASRLTESGLLGKGPVVTLTSYGDRVATVHNTIMSIASGQVKPRRIILWLDDEVIFRRLPSSLLRLQRYGLEVELALKFGPHTKYYPFVRSEVTTQAFVTADDDIIYPKWWFTTLVEAAAKSPDEIVCYRSHRVSISAGEFTPYNHWSSTRTQEGSLLNFATGVSGTYFPPVMHDSLREAGDSFVSVAPSADDVWLYSVAVKNGVRTRQVFTRPLHFCTSEDSQTQTLMAVNLTGRNDAALRSTFSALEFSRLRENST